MVNRQVVGLHSCLEVLKVRPHAIKKAYLLQNWKTTANLECVKSRLDGQKIPTQLVGESFLRKWSSGHQGVGLEVNESPILDWKGLRGEGPVLVTILDGLEDPHNLGAALRTSWLMGAKGLIVPKNRAVSLTPTVHKVASGGAEHVPVDVHVNLSEAMADLKEMGFWIYGLGHRSSKTFWDEEFPEKVALVLGAEGRGLRDKTEKNCDQILSIPQVDPGASFNASVSLAIVMAEVRRQWRNQP